MYAAKTKVTANHTKNELKEVVKPLHKLARFTRCAETMQRSKIVRLYCPELWLRSYKHKNLGATVKGRVCTERESSNDWLAKWPCTTTSIRLVIIENARERTSTCCLAKISAVAKFWTSLLTLPLRMESRHFKWLLTLEFRHLFVRWTWGL